MPLPRGRAAVGAGGGSGLPTGSTRDVTLGSSRSAARPVPIVVPRAVGRTARPPLGVAGSWYSGQLAIALTGNYGFFNCWRIVLCVSLLDDAALGRVLPLRLAAGDRSPLEAHSSIRESGVGCCSPLLAALAFAREIVADRGARRCARGSPTRFSTRWRRCAR